MIHLKIITPQRVVLDREVSSVTAPGSEGEVTILPQHVPFFTQLTDGAIHIVAPDDELLFSIGGGYLETDGSQITILVSRAINQDELDEAELRRALERAEKLKTEAKTDEDRQQALRELRRSTIDLNIVMRKRKTSRH